MTAVSIYSSSWCCTCPEFITWCPAIAVLVEEICGQQRTSLRTEWICDDRSIFLTCENDSMCQRKSCVGENMHLQTLVELGPNGDFRFISRVFNRSGRSWVGTSTETETSKMSGRALEVTLRFLSWSLVQVKRWECSPNKRHSSRRASEFPKQPRTPTNVSPRLADFRWSFRPFENLT